MKQFDENYMEDYIIEIDDTLKELATWLYSLNDEDITQQYKKAQAHFMQGVAILENIKIPMKTENLNLKSALSKSLFESLSDYKTKFKQHDWTYHFSDSERDRRAGVKSEGDLRSIYNNLSDSDKVEAAKYFKANYSIDDDSIHSKSIKSWDIDRDGIENFKGSYLKS